jgi:hypothetical protein
VLLLAVASAAARGGAPPSPAAAGVGAARAAWADAGVRAEFVAAWAQAARDASA